MNSRLLWLATLGAALLSACGGGGEPAPSSSSEPREVAAAIGPTTTDRVLKLNRRGIVNTDIALDEFATGAHTVSLWVMPEFTFAGRQDLFVSSAAGNTQAYAFGLDNYRNGNGGGGIVGDPVLYVRIGSKVARYLAPTFTKRHWHHVTLRRSASFHGTSSFHLFVDGVRLVPKTIMKVDLDGSEKIEEDEITVTNAEEIAFSSTSPAPTYTTGKVRFGPSTSTVDYFYGLVDDVRIYKRALSSAEIASAAQLGAKHSTDDLLAYFHFNSSTAISPQQPQLPSWSRAYTLVEQPWAEPVKRISRTSTSADAAIIDDPDHLAPSEATYRLPFGPNQVWRVAQGFDDPGPSHNGKSAAFSLDLVRDDVSSGLGNAQAAASGVLVGVGDYLGLTETRENNWVRLRTAPTEGLTYIHMQEGFSESYGFGYNLPKLDDPSTWWPVTTGAVLGQYGEHAKHLHIASTNEHTAADWRPMPIAFVDYWVETSNGWQWVERGQPKKGQRIKR
jgi:hypothetical protein